jgi:uncharacterized protein
MDRMSVLEKENQETFAEQAAETHEPAPIPPFVRFFKKGSGDRLLAVSVKPNTDFPVGIPISTVQNWIHSQGCDGWLLNIDAITLLAREIRKLDATKEYTVAERKDCAIEMQTTPDRLQAWIRITPAYGGVPLTEKLLSEALEKKQICVGIKEEDRARILQEGQCEKTLIAEGIPPIPGEPAKFEELVHESATKGIPQEKEYGRVDYKELGLILSVNKDTPLLRRIPPAAGTPGKAVDGTEIPAPPGPDRQLRTGQGTAISKDDPNIVIATRGGKPEFDWNFVQIESTLELDGVNPSTGNIVFDGNITISGPVEPGFKVRASQDLTVLDTVEGSDLTAGENMHLLTGVYGRGKTKIMVGGNLEARFLSECIVRCNGNIEVLDQIAHCTVECEGSIFMGRNGGKGQIFGGEILALREVQARILGSVSETTTSIGIAIPQDLLFRNAKLKQEIAGISNSLKLIENKLKSFPEDSSHQENPATSQLKEGAIKLHKKLEALQSSQAMNQNKIALCLNGKIKASEAYRGVVLHRNSYKKFIEDRVVDLIFQPPEEENPTQNTSPSTKEKNQPN